MPSYTIGLDLGQANDYSALAVVEHVYHLPPGATYRPEEPDLPSQLRLVENSVRAFHVRALRRWERGTPYPTVVEDVTALLASATLHDDAQLLFDQTGVGRAIGDLLFEAWRAQRAGRRIPWPVTFTAESKETMVNNTLIPLQQGRLRFASEDPLMDQLIDELSKFRQRLTASGRATFDAKRDKDGHGDLATAVMIALANGKYAPAGEMRYVNPDHFPGVAKKVSPDSH